MNKDEVLENKIKHLFYGQVSYFEALYLLLKLSLFDAFVLTDSKGKAIAGAIFGVIVSVGFWAVMSSEKALMLAMIFYSVCCLVMAVLLNLIFKKGGFFSYIFYAGSLPLLIIAAPCVSLICFLMRGSYIPFREYNPYNYMDRFPNDKITKYGKK